MEAFGFNKAIDVSGPAIHCNYDSSLNSEMVTC